MKRSLETLGAVAGGIAASGLLLSLAAGGACDPAASRSAVPKGPATEPVRTVPAAEKRRASVLDGDAPAARRPGGVETREVARA